MYQLPITWWGNPPFPQPQPQTKPYPVHTVVTTILVVLAVGLVEAAATEKIRRGVILIGDRGSLRRRRPRPRIVTTPERYHPRVHAHHAAHRVQRTKKIIAKYVRRHLCLCPLMLWPRLSCRLL